MFALRRKAVESAGRVPAAVRRRAAPYSTAHPEKAGDHGHDHGHHAEPQAESLGKAFYVVLAAIPITLGVYAASRPSKDGKLTGFSSLINSYSDYKEKWAARNTLHTAAIEAAAFDRNLFQSSPGTKHVDLRFPEMFNTGSPWNISAGQGPRGMEQLVAHYEKKNADGEAKKIKALEEKHS